MELKDILAGLYQALEGTAKKYPEFKKRLKEKDFTAQFKVRDNSVGRYFTFKGGKIESKAGIRAKAEVTTVFGSVELAIKILTDPDDQLTKINAIKRVISEFFKIAAIDLTASLMRCLGID